MKNRFLIWLLIVTIVISQGTTAMAAGSPDDLSEEILLEEEPLEEDLSEDILLEEPEKEELLSEEIQSDDLLTEDLLSEDPISEDATLQESASENPSTKSTQTQSSSIFKDDVYLPTGYRNDHLDITINKSADMSDAEFAETIPSKYQTEKLPNLKDQSPYGTCWAFATLGLVEINLMKKGIISQPDMSELHLAYFNYNSVVDPLGGTDGDYISYKKSDVLDQGSTFVMALHTLTKWTGVAEESKAPYSNAATVISKGLDKSLAYDDIVHIKDYYVEEVDMAAFRDSGDVSKLNVIKKMIMDTGAVGMSFGAINRISDAVNKKVYSEANNCFYNPDGQDINHSVIIVGWDDDFSKSKFSSTPPGNGAFLVRNSWASAGSAKNSYRGYFWMSYYEPSIEEYFYAVDAILSDDYQNNYQYDGYSHYAGVYGYIGGNVFTAHADGAANGESLKAVSFYTTAEKSRYTIDIYTDVTGNPTTGKKVASATTTGTTVYPGYHTVTLKEPVTLAKGQKFAVVVSLANGLLGFDGSYSGSYYKSSAKSGQSYFYNGASWRDVGGNGNFRIKAYTDNIIVEKKPLGITVNISTKKDAATGKDVNYCYVEYEPEDYEPDGAVAWSVSDTSIATIDSSGVITVKKEGDVTITATVDGVSGSITAHLKPPAVDAASISFTNVTNASITIKTGDTFTITAKVLPENTTNKTITWTSSNTSIVKVSGGKLTAVAKGTATITAKTHNGIACSAKVTVKQKLLGITVEEGTKTDTETGKEVTYCYVVYDPEDYTPEGSVAWSVSDTSIATIDSDGVLTPIEDGEVTVTAKVDGATGSLKVQVKKPSVEAESVTFPNIKNGRLTLKTKESFQVETLVLPENTTDKSLTWTTSNKFVAKVADGKITGVTRGNATIRAKTANGIVGAIRVTVKQTLYGIAVATDTRIDADTGEEIQYCYVKYTPADYPPEGKVAWSVSDEEIATIDENGDITVKKTGDVVVTAKVDGATASLEIHVEAATTEAEAVNFTNIVNGRLTLLTGDSFQVDAQVLPENTADKSLTWTTSNKFVAKVADGKISGVTRGNATIRATTTNGIVGAIRVTVKQRLYGVSVVQSTKTDADTGEEITYFYVKYTPADYPPEGKVKWTISDETVATIDENGEVDIKKAGDVVVTASVDGKTASLSTHLEPPAPPTVDAESLSFTNVNTSSIELKTGDSFTITAKVLPEDTTDKTVTWTSSDSSVVKVSAGKLTAVSKGTATITAKCSNGVSCSVEVTVKQKLLGINVFKDTKTDPKTGKEINYCYVTYDPEDYAPEGEVVWSSSDETIATIDKDGIISVKKNGEVTITAKVDGKIASLETTVKLPVVEASSVSFTNAGTGGLELKTGDTFTLTAKVLPENTTNKALTWSSSNTKVATVSAGKITALSKGNVTITAKTNNGKTCSVKVTVKQKLLGMTVVPNTRKDTENGKDIYYYTVKYNPADYVPEGKVTWTVSDENIATIDADGVLTIKESGTVKVTASVDNMSAELECTFEPETPEEGDPQPGDDPVVPTPGDETTEDEAVIWGDITAEERSLFFNDDFKQIPADLWYVVDKEMFKKGASTAYTLTYDGTILTFDDKIKVYDHTRQLTLDKDYTLVYSNNLNIGYATENRAPAFVLRGMGNYSSKVIFKFTILPADIDGAVFTSETVLTTSAAAKAKLSDMKPTVRFNGTKLRPGIDYAFTYYDSTGKEVANPSKVVLSKAGATYTIELTSVKGGNFTGAKKDRVEVHVIDPKKNLQVSKLSVTNRKGKAVKVTYTGEDINVQELFDNSDGKASLAVVKSGKKILTYGVDYDVTAVSADMKSCGKHKVRITGKGLEEGASENGITCIGNKTVTIEVTGTPLSKAGIAGLASTVEYTGSDLTIEDLFNEKDKKLEDDWRSVTLYAKKSGGEKEALEPGADKDYVVSVENTGKLGKVKVRFKGVGKYTGTVTKTVTVKAYNIKKDKDDKMTITAKDAAFSKAGAVPDVTVMFDGKVLKMGTDYTLSYKNNGKVARKNSGSKAPTVVVKGKGKFTGTDATTTFNVERADVRNIKIVTNNITFNKKGKKGYFLITPKLKEGGKALSYGGNKDIYPVSKSDYVYTYAGTTTLLDGTVKNDGDVVQATDKVAPGTAIRVNVDVTCGPSSSYYVKYDSKLEAVYKIIGGTTCNISKYKMALSEPSCFTFGSDVEDLMYDKSKYKLYYKYKGKTYVLDADDYDIVSADYNEAQGTVKIVIEGNEIYGGQKTFSYKILPKNMD